MPPPPCARLVSTVVKCSPKRSFSTYIIGRFYVLSWSLAYQVAFKLFETDKMPKGISTMGVVALVPLGCSDLVCFSLISGLGEVGVYAIVDNPDPLF